MAWKGMAMASVCVATSLPQVAGLRWYRETLANYKHDKEQPIDVTTKSQIEKVLDELKLDNEVRENIVFFSSFDNNPVHRGDANLRGGAIIGIPPTFAYRSPSDIKKSALTVGANQKHVNWDTQAGADLEQSMVLSDNARKFAIAREVKYVQTHHIYADVCLKMTFLAAGNSIIYKMNDLLQMKERLQPATRYGVYSLVGAAVFFLYLTASDTYYCWRDRKVDHKVGSLSMDFAKGGVEFYEQTLLRNQAIRKLMGPEGSKFYTMYGNNVVKWRARNVQFTARRDQLRQILAEMEAKTVDKDSSMDSAT